MESEKIIQEQIARAPKEIRDTLADAGWSQTINQIAQANNFSDEQKTALENEVLFVLLGMELLSDLQNNIQSSLAITPEITQSTVQKIKTEILNAVEEFLPKEMEEEIEDTTVPEEPSLALEIPPEDLPAVIPEEVVREVEPPKPVVSSPSAPTDYIQDKSLGINKQYVEKGNEERGSQPPSSYPAGQDPYREPIE